MKRKWPTRILCIFLALLICVSWPLKAYAAAAIPIPLPLSPPQIALLILATLGIIYAVEAGEDLFASLEREIKSSLYYNDVDFSAWLAEAQEGLIRLADCPSWISDTIKNWASGFLTGDSYVLQDATDLSGIPALNSGTLVSASQPVYFYANGDTSYIYSIFATFSHDVIYAACYSETPHNTKAGWVHIAASALCFNPLAEPMSCDGLFKYASSGEPYKFSDPRVYTNVDCIYEYVELRRFYEGPSDCDAYYAFKSSLAGYYDNSPSSQIFATSELTFGEFINLAVSGHLDTTVARPYYPGALVGGIPKIIDQGYALPGVDLPNVHLPPVYYPGLNDPSLELEELLRKLAAGEITLEEFWRLTSLGNPLTGTKAPTITIADSTYAITEAGVSEEALPLPLPDNSGDLDLTKIFPFCIPFDLYQFFSLLAADPEAPVFRWVISVPQLGINYPIEVDLSAWDNVAQLFRTLELLAFIIGLAMVTRNKFIRS